VIKIIQNLISPTNPKPMYNENICSNNPSVQEKQKREVFEDEKLLSKFFVTYQLSV
jgi:hypothetical protein